MKKQHQGQIDHDKQNFKNFQNVRMNLSRKSNCDLSKYKNLPCYSIKNSLIQSNQYEIRESIALKQKSYKKNQKKAKSQRKIKMLTQSDLDDPSPQSYTRNIDERDQSPLQSQPSVLIQHGGFIEHKHFEDNLIIKFQQLSLKAKRNVSLKDFIRHLKNDTEQLYSIRKLVINHGNIRSLEGIQLFEDLQQIHLKNNDIREIDQIYKVSNPEKIRVLNFKGNDIEDYFNARYENLVKYFPNLIQLNDKDYSFLKRKYKQQKKINMKKILRKTAKVQKQMMKTLKRQTRQNYKHHIKYPERQNPSHYYQEDDYRKNGQSYSYSPSRSRSNSKQIIRHETKSKYKNSQISQQGYYDHHYNYQTQRDEQDEMNKMNYLQTEPNQNRILKEVSLGNVQNVPLTMSIKGQKRNRKKNYKESGNQLFVQQKKAQVAYGNNRLLINTSQVQDSHRGMLTQPTATFAMQKQKQRQFDNGQTKHFMFKTLNSKQNVTKSTNNNVTAIQKNQTENFPYSVKSANRSQRYCEQEFYDMDSEISLGGISKISYNCNPNLNNNGYDQPTKRLQRNSVSNASFFTTVNNNQHNMANSQYNPTNQRNSFINGYQNQSYLTTYTKINQSMDQNCLLKQNKTQLQRAQQQTAIAFYYSTLRQKCFIGLRQYSRKRRDMPKKRVGF